MALFTIGDLHLSLGTNKPMDVFGGWHNYVQKLGTAWENTITPNDTVVLAGDTSWAMKIEDCEKDFAFINTLPGTKVLLKGNHDYWWTTRKKMDAWLQEKAFDSIVFLHNNFVYSQGVCICGTRGWLCEAATESDEKIILRETQRLLLSLQMANSEYPNAERIVFLHYPPVCETTISEPLINAMHMCSVKRCFYGHLHANMIKRAVQGVINDIDYTLISADALQFMPKKIL